MIETSHAANTPVNGQLHALGLPRAFASRENRGMAGPSTDLHRHLRAWRHALGLTLEQVANAIGSKVNTLSGWETGKRAVDLDDLRRLADAYGVDPAALLYAPGDISRGKVQGGPEFERFRRAAALVSNMTPAAAEAWLNLGQQLASSPATPGEHPGTSVVAEGKPAA